MKVLRYPIFGITCCFVSGIVVDFYTKPDTTILFIALAISFVLFCVCYGYSNRHFIQQNYFGLSVYLLSFLSGSFAHQLHYAPNKHGHYSHYLLNDGHYPIRGVITERLKTSASFEKYLFKVSEINHQKANGTLLLYAPKTIVLPKPVIGSEILLYDAVAAVPKNRNPFQFNYADYMAKRNVFHQMYLNRDNFIVIGYSNTITRRIAAYRDRLLEGFEKHHFKPETQHIINALVLGQRQDMDSQTVSAYADAGAAHILAISGLHIALLYGILLFLTKPLKRIKNGKTLQLLIPIVLLWFYALLTGFSASVVRSVTMLSFLSFGLFLNRSANSFQGILVSLLLLVAIKPNFVFDIGFQLSYMAVFAIISLQTIFQKIRLPKNPILRYLIGIVWVSFAAQVGVLPLCLYYFHQIPLLFIASNLVVLPMTTLILTLGILLTILNFIPGNLILFLGKVLSFLIETMNAYISWIASFRSLTLRNLSFNTELLFVLYIVMIALFLWFRKRTPIRLMGLLSTLILLQITYWFTLYMIRNKEELVVFHQQQHTLITIKTNNHIKVYSNDSCITKNRNLQSYRSGLFYPEIQQHPLRNMLFYNDQKILIVDRDGIYDVIQNPDIVVLINHPKINLDRLIGLVQPKLILADGTNYKRETARWEVSCRKTKIPFYATGKKGFFSIASIN
ncbi:ComEC/Rec2 family competence protein [Flavobacterium sp.]|uniref:ComEC/Rec2 family competence protein n=1 Tax=Flavobacterium sp. TaxID=239 RepID=UPI002605786F|nr:ComEC/Rec2 family competence protein [Flavobacterium sp.]